LLSISADFVKSKEIKLYVFEENISAKEKDLK
jgi:hypothetical protein